MTTLLERVFAERRRTGSMDLEAVEMAFRAALQQAGAAALSQLLQFPEPAADQRAIPCPCGSQAHYRELRSRSILTALGEVQLTRPWYLCARCHNGQFPVDRQLDVDNCDCSPGVRRMEAIVGQQGPFDRGREQMKVLAGLEVTAKSMERTAEEIGGDIAAKEQQEIRKAVQLDLPVIVGEPIPILYVQMDGTGVPLVKKETEDRKGKTDGQPAHTREVKLGCVFTQTSWDEKGYAIRDPDSTTYTGAIETAEEFGRRIYLEAWNRGWSRAQKRLLWATAPNGFGTWPTSTFQEPCRSSISITLASICGIWPADCTRTTQPSSKLGSRSTRSGSIKARSKDWFCRCAPPNPLIPKFWKTSY